MHDLNNFIDYIYTNYKVKNLTKIKSSYIREYIVTLNTYTSNKHIIDKKTSSINRSISSIKKEVMI